MALCRYGDEVTKIQWPVVSGQWPVPKRQEEICRVWVPFCRPPAADHWSLFSAGMGFAMAGEEVVGPGILAVGRGLGFACGGGGGRGDAIPICRRVGNSPYISGVVKRHSDKKLSAVCAERKAIGYA